MNYNSLHSTEHFTFNNTMERSPMDWCHQRLPVALLLPSVNFIATLYLFYSQGCCSWLPHNNLQQHQALWFDFHILQRSKGTKQETGTRCLDCCYILQWAGAEYNSRQTQGTSNATALTLDFLHVLNTESTATVYRAFLITFLINQVVKKLPDFTKVPTKATHWTCPWCIQSIISLTSSLHIIFPHMLISPFTSSL